MCTPRLRALTVATFTVALLAGPTGLGSPAAASPPTDSTAAARAYLAAHPGGQIVNENEISYDNGAFVVTLNRAETGIMGADCPFNWYCFYDRPYFGYPRGKLSSCGRQDLETWSWQDRVESVHYNMPYGSTGYFDGAYRLFWVGVGTSTIANVYPYNNMARNVYRYC